MKNLQKNGANKEDILTNNILKLNIDVPCNFLYTGIESSLDKSIAGVDAPNRDALSKLVKFRNITLSVGSDKEMRSLFKKVSILRQADKIEFTPTRRGKSYDAMTSMSEVVSGSMTEVCAAFWRCIDNCI